MAGLVESGLKNLQSGDRDAVGYFQMPLRIWNAGEYAGYATNPPLQLNWFIDQALSTENGRAADEYQWGEWIALLCGQARVDQLVGVATPAVPVERRRGLWTVVQRHVAVQ